MKVVMVGGFPPDKEGEAHYAGQVFTRLAQDFPVQVVCLAHRRLDSPPCTAVLSNLQVQRVTYPDHRWKRHLAPFYLWRAIRRLRPQVVHFQAPHKSLYGGVYGEPLLLLLRWLKRSGIPTLVTLHSLWTEEDFQLLAQERCWSPFKKRSLERLYHISHRQYARYAGRLSALVSGESNPLIDRVRQYCKIREPIYAEFHPCHYAPVSEHQTQQAKSELGLENSLLIVSVGFVRPDKNFHQLIEAVSQLQTRYPRLVLLIAGEPRGHAGTEYVKQLHQHRENSPDPQRIHLWMEYLSDARFEQLVRAADVVAIPYTRVMGASGPMHHAIGAGKPVLASNVGQNLGLQEVCALFRSGDLASLTETLERLIADTELRATYSERARVYAESHTWHHLAKLYFQHYQELTGGACL
ncbi:MAG: glycosyltransferase [Fimbriimonadales bacterium]